MPRYNLQNVANGNSTFFSTVGDNYIAALSSNSFFIQACNDAYRKDPKRIPFAYEDKPFAIFVMDNDTFESVYIKQLTDEMNAKSQEKNHDRR